ncbi:MAG TPA: hypothetical protein VFS91_00945, partial [Nitrobacter sp.]|nr:hypothetical protein [Nitrobacter sp.]
MIHDRSQHLGLSRAAGDNVAYLLALVALLFVGLLWSAPASAAQCPGFNITVPFDGSVTTPHCSAAGFDGFNPIPGGKAVAHGTVTVNKSHPIGVPDSFTYTHNGDAA